MRPIAATAIVILLSWTPAASQVVNPANGHTYFLTYMGNYVLSKALASASGGYLLSLTTVDEELWVSLNHPSATMWLGLTDEISEGTYVWESGEPLLYTHWAPGEPADATSDPSGEQDYVYMETITGLWYDSDSSGVKPEMIIEYEGTPTPSVALVSTTPALDAVDLTWSNPTPYDSIDVYREGELLVTLPGTATDFQVPISPQHPWATIWVIGRVAGAPSIPAITGGTIIWSAFHLYMPTTMLNGSLPGTARVLFDNSLICDGWTVAVCHDPDALSLIEAEHGSAIPTINSGSPPSFESFVASAEGFGSAIVVSFRPDGALPVGTGREIAVANYQASPSAATPTTSTLQFCGSPVTHPWFPFGLQVIDSEGAGLMPWTSHGDVLLQPAQFIRSDPNGDLGVDLADPVFLGAWLFNDGSDPPCLAAADSNGDLLLDIADMVFTLSYLFSQGAAPDAPFPDCGPEPLPVLGCDLPPQCP